MLQVTMFLQLYWHWRRSQRSIFSAAGLQLAFPYYGRRIIYQLSKLYFLASNEYLCFLVTAPCSEPAFLCL